MANPILSRTQLAIGGEAMSVQGVVRKTSFLLGLTAFSALIFFFYALTSLSANMVRLISFGSMFAGVGCAFLIMFKPHLGKRLAAPYALFQGLFLGGVSLLFMSIAPTIPATALAATFVTAAVMLGLYRAGVIKVTERFRSILTSAIIAIFLLYAVQWMFFAFGSSLPFLFDGGMVAVGFSLFVVVIASFSLLLDFDNIERGVAMGVSKDFEWVFGIGVLASLVWMYFEFMRLLSYLQD